MPALPADIAAATRPNTVAQWTSATIAARYANARDGSAAPADGYFDNVAEAQAVVNARGSLIGVERRRFSTAAHDVVWPADMALTTARLVDAEQGVDAPTLITRIEIDLDAETTSFELFG